MTRSLGDFYAHRHGISCEPEIVRYVVNQLPADARSAVLVLASDGLWDFLTTAEACKVMRRGRSPQACADKLVEMAVNRSKAKYNGLKDDTTAVVIELNPSGEPPPIATGADGSACCVVS